MNHDEGSGIVVGCSTSDCVVALSGLTGGIMLSSLSGAQWLSGRVLDLRLRGCRLETHQRQCIVSFSETY